MNLNPGTLPMTCEPATREKLEQLLEQAGLELWRSPEGFWAIRIKRALPKPLSRVERRRRRSTR